jgi:hypothetical protein
VPLEGTLATADCEGTGGELTDRYTFTTTAQQAVRFRQTSAALDTYLELYDAEGRLLAANDDSAGLRGHPTSTLKMILPAGSYQVSPSSYAAGETGAYSLSAATVPESENICDLVFAMRGITTIGELTTGDCTTGGTSAFLFETIVVGMQAGRTYTITLNSTAFDAYLELGNLGSPSQVVASNDNAAGTNARITYTPTVSNFYVIVASTAAAGASGAFTLIVE